MSTEEEQPQKYIIPNLEVMPPAMLTQLEESATLPVLSVNPPDNLEQRVRWLETQVARLTQRLIELEHGETICDKVIGKIERQIRMQPIRRTP